MPTRCPGFRFAGVAAGIKASGAPDLALLVSDRPAAAAAVFTRNKAAAAPVSLSRRALRRSGGRARAIVVNSGNANACTGPQGSADARRMAARTADALGLDRGEVLVASTGVIGAPLPMDAVDAGIDAAARAARATRFDRFAEAILTTDRSAKIASRTLRLGARRITLLGCTKGAGMIAPNMATTLSFVATDATLAPADLDRALRDAVEPTFNAITIDGDTSTNDMIAVLANGSGRAHGRADVARFAAALTDLLDELARALMRDGEGVHHVVEIRVVGARSDGAARRIARTVADSPLVKTAIAGGDPNWGRILAAAGRAGAPLRPERADLAIGEVPVLVAGRPAGGADGERRAARAMRAETYAITLDLHDGEGRAHCLTCDLSHEYVSLNADYRT